MVKISCQLDQQLQRKKFHYLSNRALCLSNYDIIMRKAMTSSFKSYSPWGVLDNEPGVKNISMEWFQRCGGAKFFLVFPRWCLYHVTYDIIIMTKKFCRKRRTDLENFLSITLNVAEKINFWDADTYGRHMDATNRLTPLFTSRVQGKKSGIELGGKMFCVVRMA